MPPTADEARGLPPLGAPHGVEVAGAEPSRERAVEAPSPLGVERDLLGHGEGGGGGIRIGITIGFSATTIDGDDALLPVGVSPPLARASSLLLRLHCHGLEGRADVDKVVAHFELWLFLSLVQRGGALIIVAAGKKKSRRRLRSSRVLIFFLSLSPFFSFFFHEVLQSGQKFSQKRLKKKRCPSPSTETERRRGTRGAATTTKRSKNEIIRKGRGK